MFKPVSVFIGLRYIRAKRRNHFISFISLMSMLGIALGVLVLITVLSVMNGFDQEIQKRVFSMFPPVTVSSELGYVSNWQEAEQIIHKSSAVKTSAPFVNGQVLLTNENSVQPALLNGIIPAEEKKVSQLAEKMIIGNLASLKPGDYGIVLGEELAARLGVNLGDKITAITPQMSLSLAGALPRYKRFTVTGIFRAGGGFGFDMAYAFISLGDAQKLFQLGQSVTGLHVTIDNVYQASQVSRQLETILGPNSRVTDWTEQFGAYFNAVSLEKTMMFFILLLIVAVAVFNLVSTLVMVVNEKESDIAILRTFGASPQLIMRIFIVQGAVVGVVGTLLGVAGGIALALNVTVVVKWIESLFHVHFLSSSVYILDYLPSHLEWADVIKITMVSLGLSFIATIYPAWRASCTEPVEALRYE